MNRYALWAVFGPQAWIFWAVLVAVGALLVFRRDRARAVRVARRASLVALVLMLVIFVAPTGWLLIEPLEHRFPTPARVPTARDIIVLTGGERLGASARHHRPEFGETGDRTTAGAMLAHALPAARLWTVGGVDLGPGTPRDVDWARAAWILLGVAPARIVVVGDTADTCANARGVARRLGADRRPLLVTSAFHMPRAVACFRGAGLDPQPYPVDYQNGAAPDLLQEPSPDFTRNAQRFDYALHEYVGLLFYRLGGRTRELWPKPRPAAA